MITEEFGVEIIDKDDKFGTISAFHNAEKACSYFFHVAFLECCKYYGIKPNGLLIDKNPFITFVDKDLMATWESTIEMAED